MLPNVEQCATGIDVTGRWLMAGELVHPHVFHHASGFLTAAGITMAAVRARPEPSVWAEADRP